MFGNKIHFRWLEVSVFGESFAAKRMPLGITLAIPAVSSSASSITSRGVGRKWGGLSSIIEWF